MTRVLVVDDEVKLGRLLAEALSDDGHEVVAVSSGRSALVELAASIFDVVITDLRMPEIDGLAVLAQARARPSPPDVIMITAHATTESAVAAMKAGAADYLTKPFALDEARLRVRRLSEQRRNKRRSTKFLERLTPNLVANDARSQQTLEAAQRVASTDATVLLLGESGTGKSQLARFIHYGGQRADGPLVELNCSALPETLLESELFGHVRGAFTGADTDKRGHLAAADGGTLFLDEIGEVSLATQVKLLRFLQEREFLPVGSTEPQRVDVRVVAATNRDLRAAVEAKTFREDFFYRLHVFAIDVPALRDRPDDVAPLAERFLAGKGLPLKKLSADALERMRAYRWPGNVRELENTLERALIIAGEGEVESEHLGLSRVQPGPRVADLLGPDFNLDSLERDVIYAALERAGGNKTAAARLLGITRRRLYSRLDSLANREADDGE